MRDQIALSCLNGIASRADNHRPTDYQVIVTMAYNVADEVLKFKKDEKKLKEAQEKLECIYGFVFGNPGDWDNHIECGICKIYDECNEALPE